MCKDKKLGLLDLIEISLSVEISICGERVGLLFNITFNESHGVIEVFQPVPAICFAYNLFNLNYIELRRDSRLIVKRLSSVNKIFRSKTSGNSWTLGNTASHSLTPIRYRVRNRSECIVRKQRIESYS